MDFLDLIFLNNPIKSWIFFTIIMVASWFFAKAVYWFFSKVLKRLTEKTATTFDDIVIDMIEEPVVFGARLAGFWFAFSMVSFSETIDLWIANGFGLVMAFNIGWMVVRLSDSLVKQYVSPLTTGDFSALLPIITQVMHVGIWLMTAVIAFDNIGFDIAGALAGLGILGLGLAMAAKDSLSNIFGGITIFADQSFKVGDRIKIEGFDGTITAIGIRSSKLKTLEGRIVTIPNGKFTDNCIENVSGEDMRKIVLDLGLTYDMTQDKIEEAMRLLHNISEMTEGIEEDSTVIGFNAFGDFALGVRFIYYIKKDADIMGTQTFVNLAILDNFADSGIEMAFPTQTVLHQQI